MLAILYLALALFFGDRLRRLLLPPAREIYVSLTTRGVSDLPAWLFDLPAAAMMGLPPAMWLTYAAGYLSAKIPGLGTLANPLLPANIIAMPMLFIMALAMTAAGCVSGPRACSCGPALTPRRPRIPRNVPRTGSCGSPRVIFLSWRHFCCSDPG
jgi:hypothetical protein